MFPKKQNNLTYLKINYNDRSFVYILFSQPLMKSYFFPHAHADIFTNNPGKSLGRIGLLGHVIATILLPLVFFVNII